MSEITHPERSNEKPAWQQHEEKRFSRSAVENADLIAQGGIDELRTENAALKAAAIEYAKAAEASAGEIARLTQEQDYLRGQYLNTLHSLRAELSAARSYRADIIESERRRKLDLGSRGEGPTELEIASAEIEDLKRQRDALRAELSAAREEVERLNKELHGFQTGSEVWAGIVGRAKVETDALRAQLSAAKEPLQKLAEALAAVEIIRDACRPILDTPGCAWCGHPSLAFVNRFDGQQCAYGCADCIRQFGDTATITEITFPDFGALRAALVLQPPPSALHSYVAPMVEAAFRQGCEIAYSVGYNHNRFVPDELWLDSSAKASLDAMERRNNA